MTRRLVALAAVLLLVACGGDDDDAVATEDDHGHADAGEPNPCGPDGDGTLAGMEGEAPAGDATEVTIEADEYEFSGTDALAAGGDFAVTFDNRGDELHELVVLRLPEGDERPLDALLADEAIGDEATTVGQSFACPGATADPVAVDLAEAGRYVVVCFLPSGATPETDPEDFDHLGPAHALAGMAAELTVGG